MKTNYKILFPDRFAEYKLIDSGNRMKLEQFGAYTLIRPEPQALWDPQLEYSEWEAIAHAKYETLDSHKGKWRNIKGMAAPWKIKYKSSNYALQFELRFTQFKHIGLFPEQASHWDYIYDQCKKIPNAKVLNLFSYTGGATLAAKAAGADVIHLDSVKQVVNWSSRNMELSGLKDVRWLVEDALKFVQREARRGNFYNGIIMDPPSYGLGPKGERWKLEDKLNELVANVCQILDKHQRFMVFNTYSLNLSAYILQTMVESRLGNLKNIELGELGVKSSNVQTLPLGSFLRFGM